jgi:tRNA pseudouridine13 synthase
MLTLTRRAGTGGAIKQAPEDFVVKEITNRGFVLQQDTRYDAKSLGMEEVQGGKHISFVLQKRDWNTVDALVAIAKRLGHGRKSIAYAGSKDKKAISVQLASVFHPQEFDLGSVQIKDIKINGFWRSNGVELGDDLGNAFEVTVKSAEHAERVEEIANELGGKVPNYFGEQRFGDRGNNAKVGAAILRGDFKEAAIEYLTGTSNERNEEVKSARAELKERLDFAQAIERFPRYLKGERTVLTYLSRYPNNYANALKLLPRGIALMFIHAVQAEIFNEELEQRIKSGDFRSAIYAGSDFYGFPDIEKIGAEGYFALAPLVGCETKDEELSDYAKAAMQRMQLGKEAFACRGMPELAMKGAYRPLLAPVKDLSYKAGSDSFWISFSLPKGSYATVLLKEFMKGSEN